MKKVILIAMVVAAGCGLMWWSESKKTEFWAGEYARVISTPDIADPNSAEYYKQESSQWRIAAEHYGGICKWFSENHDIADNVTMGDNAVLSNCLVVSNGWVEINGENATVMNCEFRTWDMDWVKSLEAVDPNNLEVARK